MQNKLQELTDRLYTEGLSKGKEEGEALLAKAKAEAGDIVAEAQKKAAAILEKAERDAADYKVKITGDLKMAASQSVQAVRKDIESLVVTKMTGEAVGKAMSGEEFVKEIIRAVASKFNAEEAVDMNLVLPEALKSGLEPFVKSELAGILGSNVSAEFSRKISGGFTIGPKDGGYFISFTDDTFKELISNYLRPTTKKLLFGE